MKLLEIRRTLSATGQTLPRFDLYDWQGIIFVSADGNTLLIPESLQLCCWVFCKPDCLQLLLQATSRRNQSPGQVAVMFHTRYSHVP